jgi:hypothetical protein
MVETNKGLLFLLPFLLVFPFLDLCPFFRFICKVSFRSPSREGEESCPNLPKELVAVGPKAGVADEVEISESTGACWSFVIRVDIVGGGDGGETFCFLNDRCDVGEPCDGRFDIAQVAYNCLC